MQQPVSSNRHRVDAPCWDQLSQGYYWEMGKAEAQRRHWEMLALFWMQLSASEASDLTF